MKRLLCRQFLCAGFVTLFLLTPGCLSARSLGETETRNTNTKTPAKSDTKTTTQSGTKATTKSDAKATTKSGTKATTKSDTKATTKVETKALPKSDAKTGNEPLTVKLVRSLQLSEKIALVKDQHDILTMSIKSGKGDLDEAALSAEIVKRMNSALSHDIAIKPDDDKCDVRVEVSPNLEFVDEDDDYFRMSCSVDIEMKSADGKRLFGATKIDLGAPRRVLGYEESVAAFTEPAADSAVEWCRKELNRIVDSEIGMTLISFSLPAVPEGKERNLQKDAASIIKIGNTLEKQKKILKYELVSQDSRNGICIYRVVYFTSEYPNGLVNELNALFSATKQN